MTGELFKAYTGVNILHIPYKGGAPAIVDLVAGQIPMMFDNVPPLLPHVRAGRIKPLAVTSLARIAVLPDVPTLHELGLKDFDAVGWNGLLAPAGARARSSRGCTPKWWKCCARRKSATSSPAGRRHGRQLAGRVPGLDQGRGEEVGRGGEGVGRE